MTDSFSTLKRHDVERLLTSCDDNQDPARTPQYGSLTKTEDCAAKLRSVSSRAVG